MTIYNQIQQNLNYQKLQPIDPNTGTAVNPTGFNPLQQAAVVTFLAAVYKSSRLKENASILSKQKNTAELLSLVFTDRFDAYQAIADFTGNSLETIKQEITNVAGVFIGIIQQQPEDSRDTYLQNTMTSERDDILNLIPSQLKIERLVNDETINDNTNKMQGPISTLMHKIENTFSTSD